MTRVAARNYVGPPRDRYRHTGNSEVKSTFAIRDDSPSLFNDHSMRRKSPNNAGPAYKWCSAPVDHDSDPKYSPESPDQAAAVIKYGYTGKLDNSFCSTRPSLFCVSMFQFARGVDSYRNPRLLTEVLSQIEDPAFSVGDFECIAKDLYDNKVFELDFEDTDVKDLRRAFIEPRVEWFMAEVAEAGFDEMACRYPMLVKEVIKWSGEKGSGDRDGYAAWWRNEARRSFLRIANQRGLNRYDYGR